MRSERLPPPVVVLASRLTVVRLFVWGVVGAGIVAEAPSNVTRGVVVLFAE